MIQAPNAFIVPALPGHMREASYAELASIGQACTQNGIRPIDLNIPRLWGESEYSGDMSSYQRSLLAGDIARCGNVIDRMSVVVIANAGTENIYAEQGGDVLCKVPRSIGRFAGGIISVASQMYGKNSGRIFVSSGYPDLTELEAFAPTRNAVRRARKRLRDIAGDLSVSGVIALNGGYEQMIQAAKTPHARAEALK